MKKSLILIWIMVIGLAAAFLLFNARELSIIGEEGYKAYDPLLSAGGYDQARWTFVMPNCVTVTNTRRLACELIREWDGVTVSDNTLFVSGNRGPDEGSPVGMMTGDLRLKDFRADFVTIANRNGANANIATSTLSTSKGPVYTSPSKMTYGTSNTDDVFVQLVWDDYERGHYVVKINGATTQEGFVPEGEQFFFSWTANPVWGDEQLGTTAGLQNPRYSNLFACDLQEGKVRVHDCATGPGTVNIEENMPGWTGFCPSEPAIITAAGIEASSKQVYYSWAAGKTHTMQTKNDRIEWNYLADAREQLGYTITETGVVERCAAEFTPIQDLQDIEVPAPIIKDSTLWWSSSGIKDDGRWESKSNILLTGSKMFFAPGDLEIGCDYPEGEVLRYPGDISANCFTVDVFDRELKPGEKYVLNDYFSVTFDDLEARFINDGLDESIRYFAQWKLEFKKNGVLAVFTAPANAALGSDVTGTVDLKNAFPFPVTVTSSVKTTAESVGEETFTTFETFINTQATKTAALDTALIGPHEVVVSNVLQTSVGPVMLEQSPAFEYEITRSGAISAADAPVESKPWYARIWEWIVEVLGL